jgi:quinoprotein glucose dehydrogenase
MRTFISGLPVRMGWLAVATLIAAGCSDAEEPSSADAATASTEESLPPRGSEFDHATWEQSLGGADSSQYSSLDQINRTNVGQLTLAWSFATSGGTPNFNPIVVNDVMYVLDTAPPGMNSAFVALNAATGEDIWRHVNEDGNPGSRGIKYGESDDGTDRRLVYLAGGAMTQLNAATGEPITSFGDNGKVDLRIGFEGDISNLPVFQHNNPGRIFEDIAIFSLPARGPGGGASYTALPADIHAYNILTGELEWVFHVIPRPGEPGAETWPAEGLAQGLGGYGGGHNWSEFTVDEELGIAYVPTGTARFDFYGGNRAGANLYTNSLLALNARTGELLWHFQTIHHDLWDYDIPQAPKLLTLNQGGTQIRAVAQATKQGLLFVFDRETGDPVWPIVETPFPASDVPGETAWPTQPIPSRPPPFARQSFTVDDINPYRSAENQAGIRANLEIWRNEGLYTPPSLQGSISIPGHNGGTNWGGSAVDPVNGRFFTVSKELPTLDKLSDPATAGAGRGGGGGRAGGGRGGRGGDAGPPPPIPGAGEGFIAYSSPVDFMVDNEEGMPAIGPPWSQLTAYNLDTGDILWQVPNGGVYELMQQGINDTGSQAPRGGPVVTAGGLVFVATSSDRKLRARNTDTGATLWEYDLPAGSDGVPAVYAVNGREFIVVPVGGNGSFSQGLDIPPAGPSQYMVFALPAP